MLNLNSLKVIDVDVFLLVSYYFVFFKYSMISFFVAPGFIPKADTKVQHIF